MVVPGFSPRAIGTFDAVDQLNGSKKGTSWQVVRIPQKVPVSDQGITLDSQAGVYD